MSTSDLMVVVYELKKGLDQGQKLEKLIESSIYFHPSFKKYCLILLKQGKSMSLLEDYVEKTMLYLEKKIKIYSRITVFIIYSSTSLFIVILYLLMMLPMFQIVSQL